MKFIVTVLSSVALFLPLITVQSVNLKLVKCLVCRTVVDEFEHEVSKIDPKMKMEIGQYKLDSKGNAIQKKVPLALSEVHLSDMLDSICKKMDNYVRATYKSNGKLILLKLITDDGMNPLMAKVDIVQDGDLNKSLEYACIDIVNEYEDTFIKIVSKKEENAKDKICTEITEYCTEFMDSLDQGDDDDVGEEFDDAEKTENQDYDKTELMDSLEQGDNDDAGEEFDDAEKTENQDYDKTKLMDSLDQGDNDDVGEEFDDAEKTENQDYDKTEL